MISDLTASKQAEQERRACRVLGREGQAEAAEKAAVKKARRSAGKKSSDKPRLKRR